MELIQGQFGQRQSTSCDIELSSMLTINHLPDELLVEIFDFYRQQSQHKSRNCLSNHSWSIKLGWFNLIHVCNRWRTVMFASPSRLDLYFVLGPNQKGDMKTIMSRRHSPPLPIEIDFNGWFESWGKSVTTKEMDRILAALKQPDRIRGITLTGSADDLNKLFKATRRPFPALENLALCERNYERLNIPAAFLKGTDLHLRTLRLQHVSLPSISRFLSSAPALTDLTLYSTPRLVHHQ
ncbi:hypothetical protein BJV77DRAFT_313349 [Russula vinacea]|nr:hypothetical protein BJV77DRAFT_313349 [Russula vinacea]